MHELDRLTRQLRDFAAERDWDQFHSPKNLAMALAAETGELLEPFQWLTEEQSTQLDTARRVAVAAEAADVFIYLLRLCDRLQIDLLAATTLKLEENAAKYPVEKVRGKATKYDEY